jgi:hypothetical protein
MLRIFGATGAQLVLRAPRLLFKISALTQKLSSPAHAGEDKADRAKSIVIVLSQEPEIGP